MGSENRETFIGTDAKPGCHFYLVVVHRNTKLMIYGDSLGWMPPNNIFRFVGQFLEEMFPTEYIDFTIRECHSSKSRSCGHIGDVDCCTAYPLQKDGFICGVIAVVMLAVAVLEPCYFETINQMRKKNQQQRPFNYLDEPKKYRR